MVSDPSTLPKTTISSVVSIRFEVRGGFRHKGVLGGGEVLKSFNPL